jgi:outer membrane protein OmpA-like peptidoglycan-associated protein
MQIFGPIVLAGLVLAAAPSEARGFYRGPHFGVGFGFGYPSCWGCGPYQPYYGPYYGPPYYGPAYPPPPYNGLRYAPPPLQESDNNWHVTRRQGETDYELPDNVLFALDSATISADANNVLNQIARAAQDQPNSTLVVEGHTDTSGSPSHNQELSDARARAVADELAREGVARTRIRSEGLGERDLAVQTGESVREARNRRVVIRLMNTDGSEREQVDRNNERN